MTQDNSGNDRPDLEPDTGSTRYTPSSREGGDDAGYDAGYDAVYDAEIVDDDPAYRGAHRRDEEDADYDVVYAGGADDAVYDEPYEDEPGERAAGGAEGGLPKRGLAMILIAVAALLLLWGIYAMTQRDTSSDTSAESSASQSVAAPSQDAQGQNSQGQNTQGQNTQGQSAAPSANQASPASPSAASPSANPANPANPSAANPSAGQDAGQQNLPAAQPNAEGGQGLQASDAEVLVYNNSGVPNAAQETADKLHNQYRVANDSHDVAAMNMPEQNYGVFPETYVFYNPQVAGADKVAADVARQVGGTPRSTKDLPGGGLSLPAQANNPNAITVVIAG